MKHKQSGERGLVSVIIPVWNTGTAAVKLVQSLVQQKYRPIEIIVVDDGSTDNSLSEIRKAVKRLGKSKTNKGLDTTTTDDNAVIKVLTQENAGAAAARNAGINISQGEYLCFIDSDDEVAPEFITRLVETMKKGETGREVWLAVTGEEYRKLAKGTAEAVYVSPRRKRRNREKLADYVIYLMLLDGRMYGSINKIYRAEIVQKNDVKFQVGRDFAEDTQFVLDYLAAEQMTRGGDTAKNYSSGDISFILEPCYVYNFGTATSTVRGSATKWENWQQAYRDLREWAEKVSGIGLRTRILLLGIKLRWRISYARSVKRAAEIDSGARRNRQPQKVHHVGKFVAVGITVTLIDFVLCTILTRGVFRDNHYQALSAAIATSVATLIAYVLHSKITWRERKPAKYGVVKFFAWNMFVAILVRPVATEFFGLLTGLYQFALMITQWLRLPFDFETVEYLGIYALVAVVTMTLNFFFYDTLVFGRKPKQKSRENSAGR